MKNVNWNLWFYAPFCFALAIGLFVLFTVEKGDDVLFLNSLHTPFLDNIFYYGTILGNGWLYIVVAVALLWKNYRTAMIAFVCFSLTGILAQILKKLVFDEMLRPGALLAHDSIHFVEGVKILRHHSFPSGHTATAFSLFCLLSQIVKPRWMGLMFVMMALIGGISRIYLVQHFFIDVYFGAILGVTVTSLVWLYFSYKSVSPFLNEKSISSVLKS